eukprot:399041-Hanusia_phi.AAC.1
MIVKTRRNKAVKGAGVLEGAGVLPGRPPGLHRARLLPRLPHRKAPGGGGAAPVQRVHGQVRGASPLYYVAFCTT